MHNNIIIKEILYHKSILQISLSQFVLYTNKCIIIFCYIMR